MTRLFPARADCGTPLNASLEMHKRGVVLHSRSGTNRNADYRTALELTLLRLDSAQIAYTVHLDSQPVQGISLAKRQLLFDRQASAAERFDQIVRAMNAAGRSRGAWRRLLIATPGTKSAKLWTAISGAGVVELRCHQRESDLLFRRWADTLIGGSTAVGAGWVVEGTGIIFTNSGQGNNGTIETEVMLGVDSSARDGVVKIVKPKASQQGRGKLTAIGWDEQGRPLLLRQGWLKKNRISGEVRRNFSKLSGLMPVVVSASGLLSSREWYVVADLSAPSDEIVKATTSFAIACALARYRTNGRSPQTEDTESYRLGLDEKGRTKEVTIAGGTKEVVDLQGYVWAELKRLIGSGLTKPTKHGYAVDAMIKHANLLIEIKTGVSAQDVYEAVGQLALYPSLIELPAGLKAVLLLPNQPLIRPQMAAALAASNIEVYLYSVGRVGENPTIEFPPEFIRRCQSRSQ